MSNKIEQKFKNVFEFKNKKKEIEHNTFMLGAFFLSVVLEYKEDLSYKQLAKILSISKKKAKNIIHLNKKLTLKQISKIETSLGIKFEIKLKK